MQRRLQGQKDLLAKSKEALDVALANSMVSLATQCDARCKRQAAACGATQAAIVEIERAIADFESRQIDFVESASAGARASNGVPDPEPTPVTRKRR